MHARGVGKWQSRRKISLGPVRRACPASGATWNVQVVRGKMTTRCLWHACRALILGLLLMIIGAGMATIGYYAEHIATDNDARSNSTIRVKTDSKGIHLHNLSYAGPIVMGCGGFIIVAACVMTFEARDSAAKVVPARFKLSTTTRANAARLNSTRRIPAASGLSSTHAVGSQTGRWDNQLGVFRTSPGGDGTQSRTAQTAALVHFSKMLCSPRHSPKERRVSRSDSVPNLTTCYRSSSIGQQSSMSPTHRNHTHHRSSIAKGKIPRGRASSSGRAHLNAILAHRQGASFDETGPYFRHHKSSIDASTTSNDHCSKRDRNKRSDTAKRHVLARQKQVDNSEKQNRFNKSRSNSTNSDISSMFRKSAKQKASVSRTHSIDSRAVQTDDLIVADNPLASSPNRKRCALLAQTSTPSVDAKFRSQISICSEPSNIPLYQLSIDQCLPEENLKAEDPTNEIETQLPADDGNASTTATPVPMPMPNDDIDGITDATVVKRPNSLLLNCNRNEFDNNFPCGQQQQLSKKRKQHRYLYRSNSSSLHKRPTTLVPITSAASNSKYELSSELDQIYFISSNKDDDNYDSIEVIDERRMKNLPKSEKARLYKSNTFVCEEYYTSAQSHAIRDKEQITKTKTTTTTTTTTTTVERSANDETAEIDESQVQMTTTKNLDKDDKQEEKQ